MGPVQSLPVPMLVSDRRAALVLFYVQANDWKTAVPMYAAMTRLGPTSPWTVFELAERTVSGAEYKQDSDQTEKVSETGGATAH